MGENNDKDHYGLRVLPTPVRPSLRGSAWPPRRFDD
jgi:hypothetical protein